MKVSPQQIDKLMRAIDASLLKSFNFSRFLARFLPPAVLVGMANGIGYALYYLRRGRRCYLLEAMGEALPDIKDERELKRLAREASGAAIRAMLDLVLLERHTDKVMERLILDEEWIKRYDEYRTSGGGLIIFTPHLGGIAITPCLAALLNKFHTPIIMDPQATPIPHYLTALMEVGNKVGSDPENPAFWAGKNSIGKVREHLAKGGCAALTFDVGGSTVIDFFGRPAAMASGVAHFACDSNAPMAPGFFKRGKGPLDYELMGCPDVSYTLTGDRDQDVKAILAQVIESGEQMIRMAPEQWVCWLNLRDWRKRAQKILEEKGPSL
jgi:lauroyl/myristoyl acyltransferase